MDIKKRIRPTKKWIVWMIAVTAATLGILIVSLFLLGSNNEKKGGANINGFKPKAPNGIVGGRPVTDKYNETLAEFDSQRIDQEAKEGKSSVPTVMGAKEVRPKVKKIEAEKNDKKVPTVKRDIRKAEKKENTEEQKRRKQEAEEKKELIALYAKSIREVLNTKRDYKPHVAIYYADYTNTDKKDNDINTLQKNSSQTDETQNKEEPLPFEMGEILYSTNVIAINSDVPSPVVARVESGAYKGTKFFGNFARHDKWLFLKFNQCKPPGQKPQAVSAIAIDTETYSAAVRSGVDTHFLQRWGGLILGSALEGFGEAVSKSGQSYKSTETTETFTYPEYSVDEQLWIAAGKVGTRVANNMEKNFNRNPTVYEDNDAAFGIMILSAGDK